MTESEWQSNALPNEMLEELAKQDASWRKLRLFCLACCRRLAIGRPDWPRASLVGALEEALDGTGEHLELPKSMPFEDRWFLCPDPSIEQCFPRPTPFDGLDALLKEVCQNSPPNCNEVMFGSIEGRRFDDEQFIHEMVLFADFIRDIFGNPFRIVSFSESWRTSTAVSLAKGMYESRNFSAMPLLADALEDAGCSRADILDHCRGSGPHVRGCWVVDLVLNKS